MRNGAWRQVGVDDEQRSFRSALADALGNRVEMRLLRSRARTDNVRQFRFGELVDLTDARTRNDVVELVAEQHPPMLLQ